MNNDQNDRYVEFTVDKAPIFREDFPYKLKYTTEIKLGSGYRELSNIYEVKNKRSINRALHCAHKYFSAVDGYKIYKLDDDVFQIVITF